MIFKPELVKLIRSGQKTQTRRPVAGETECRYQPGKAYALQPGRGKPAIGRITITDVRQERLGDISFKDVRREGFKTTVEFRDYWTKLHARYDPDLLVWVITFELGDTRDTPRLLAARIGGTSGDYTSIPALAAPNAGEAVTEHEQALMAVKARERDHARMNEPLRKERDQVARALEAMKEHAGTTPIRNSVRRLERELEILNRKLAA